MIEAFEIGITLALDNGVASGIAAIRQDLDALDRAIANSSAGLATLRSLSAGIQPPAFQSTNMWSVNTVHPAKQSPAASPIPQLAGTPDGDDTASAPSANIEPELPPPTRPAVPVVSDYPAPTRIAAPQTETPQEHRPPIQIIAPSAAHEPPSAPATTSNIDPISSSDAPKSFIPTSSRTGDVLTPIPALQAASYVLAPPSLPKAASSMHTPPEQRPPPRVDDLPIWSPPTRLPTEFVPTVAPAPPRPTPIQPEHGVPFAPNRSAAPSMVPSRSVSPNRFDAPANQPITPDPLSPAQSSSKTTPHGEIILDGARLGRWMSDRLARAADRPSSGMTGFDPRISPNHAGAPNGS